MNILTFDFINIVLIYWNRKFILSLKNTIILLIDKIIHADNRNE